MYYYTVLLLGLLSLWASYSRAATPVSITQYVKVMDYDPNLVYSTGYYNCTNEIITMLNNVTNATTGNIRAWSANDGTPIRSLTLGNYWSRDLSCMSRTCAALSPNGKTVNFFDTITGTSYRPTGGTNIKDPQKIFAFQVTDTLWDSVTVDYAANSTIARVSVNSANQAILSTVTNVTKLNNTARIVGIYYVPTNTVAIAYENDTTIRIFDLNSQLLTGATFGTFGSIGLISYDYYARTFVYDLTCLCIKILNSAGQWIKTIEAAALNNPHRIMHTRNNIFVVDDSGVKKFSEPLTLNTYNSSAGTCTTRAGTSFVSVLDGAAPFTYQVYPDQTFAIRNSRNYTANLAMRRTDIGAYYIYTDSIYLDFSDAYTGSLGYRNAQTTANAFVTPYSGTYMYSMQVVNNTIYGFNSSGVIDTSFFSGVQFMLNLGNGGQNFSVALDTVVLPMSPPLSSIAPNTWTQVTVDFSSVRQPIFNALVFRDLSNLTSTNVLYLDDIVLVPYPTDDREMRVFDSCGAVVTTPTFNINLTDPLSVSIVTTPTSCNAGGRDGALAYDGVLSANVTGGQPPYTYQWSAVLQNSTASQVTGLAKMRSNIVVYDNSLNSTFKDSISAASYSLNDTSLYHSAPSSFSWAPSTNAETLGFSSLGGLNAASYSAFEFWVNGGSSGQQMISVTVTRNTALLGTTYRLNKLLGIPSIPANTWLKASLPITPDMGIFTGLTFQSVGSWSQPEIYFDDLNLISTDLTVTVMDAGNCTVYMPYIEVVSPALMTATPIVNELSCYQTPNGGVTFDVEGGTAPYFFNWSIPNTAVTSNSTSGLSQSRLSADIYDSHGCHVPNITVVDVLQPPVLSIVAFKTPMQCYGGTGGITATAIGGSAPYSYVWTSTNASAITVVPQPAPVSVFDDKFSLNFALPPPPMNLTSSVICQGTGDYIGLSYIPSYSGYCSLQFDPSNTSLTVFSVGCVGCIDTTQYNAIEFFILLENLEDAEHMKLGLFTNNVATSQSVSLVNASTTMNGGWQKVHMDFMGVTQDLADTVNIKSTKGNVSRIIVDDVVLIPKSTLVNGNNGVNAGFNSIITVAAGMYTLSITDGKSCPVSQSFSIEQPPKLTVDAAVHQPTAQGKKNGAIYLNITGGTPPYNITWQHSTATTPGVDGVPPGTYFVSITDFYGCPVSSSFVVTDPSKSNTGVIAGSAGGVGFFVLGAVILTAFFVRRQRQEAVQALIDVEEGERRAYKLDFSALELKSLIGAGSFGEVFSGEYKGADVAVKKLRSQQMSKQQIDEFARESATMVGLRHPNILLFMGVCLEPQRLCIVTELMPRGNLSDILRDENILLPIQVVFKMALDTLKGLQFIHSSGIIHRDLKSPNLLVDKHWNIKIADFGLSCARHNAQEEAQVSLLWTAPEILCREPNCYTFASDMYSFAIIFWELLTKKIPWEDTNPAAITSKVVGGQRPPLNPDWDAPTRNLINSSWTQNPLARPSVKQARSILESEIIPLVGDIDIAGSSTSYSFTKQDSPNLQVPAPQPPFCIVVCSVEGSTSLWEENPKAMCRGMEAMVKILREFATKLGGYEISQDSPSIYGFSNPVNALNFTLRTQDTLRNHEWDQALLACAKAKADYLGDLVLHRGLRVRTGIHWGFPSLRRDPETGRVSYVGAAIGTAVAISTHTRGGTIVLDQEMYNKLMSPSATLDIDPFSINPIGSTTFEGKSTPLFKMVPAVLKELLEETSGGETADRDDEQQPWLINFEDIKLEALIGTGSFGDVHSAIWNGKRVAAKKFVRQKINSQLVLEMRTECAVLRGLNHPNIIKFEAMCIQAPNLCLVSELMERGSLASILASSAEIPWSRRLAFARDTAEGLACLHKNDIIHRDVKSSNLLVGSDWGVKIADFGFSRIKAANQTMTQCGTVAWTAPEIFDGSHYTEKADVYSYGVVLWELIFRKKPWHGKHSMKVIQTVETGGRLPMVGVPPDTPQRIINLIQACWHQTPAQRPSFPQIIQQLRDD